MLREENCRKKKTNILFAIFSPKNLVHYETIWGKCGTARHATADKTIRRKKDATLMQYNYGKAADTHSLHLTLLLHGNNSHANAPKCYVVNTVLVSFQS
jgi:hypothetical protein